MSKGKLVPTAPVVFGEILFDVFPDGTEVPGGAPFNVAWHLHHFGCRPLMISRVGRDERGKQVLARMRDVGMDTRGIQIDDHHPTGVVQVTFVEGQPQFDIAPNAAYDFIDWPAMNDLLASISGRLLLAHGTLAIRSPVTLNAFSRLIEVFYPPVFVDVNLRAPWWDEETVKRVLREARWVKLNADELRQVVPNVGDLLSAAQYLVEKHKLDTVIVTEGEQGATVCRADGETANEAALRLDRFVDSVGAGDAFCAVMVAGLLMGWPMGSLALTRAIHFAAEICQTKGATNAPPELYQRLKQEWQLS